MLSFTSSVTAVDVFVVVSAETVVLVGMLAGTFSSRVKVSVIVLSEAVSFFGVAAAYSPAFWVR